MPKETQSDIIKSPVNQDELSLLINELRKRIYLTEFPLVPRTDDEFLAKFIRTKNYDIDLALLAVRKYYANVLRNLHIVKGLRPEHCKNGFYSKFFNYLRERHGGARVVTSSIRDWKPKEHTVHQLILSGAFVIEEETKEIETQENGFIAIADLSGLRWEHIRAFNLIEIHRILVSSQEGLPMKISAVHFVNPSRIFWLTYYVIIRLVKEKLRRRVHVHNNLESLHQFVSKEILPVSFGGLVPDDKADDTQFYEGILQRNISYDRYWNGTESNTKAQVE